jgi:8-oxo-dGTP pyrophosphatase MutT (NUDIX family)
MAHEGGANHGCASAGGLDERTMNGPEIRGRLARALDAADRGRGGDPEPRPNPCVAAAVLIPLVERDGGMTVLLTQRTDHLDDHPGQISFPGGRAEAGDADPVETALRETEEEIGLGRRHIDVLGRLDTYDTVTGFRITPVIGAVAPGFSLTLDSFEVAEAFEVPLAFILDARNCERRTIVFEGRPREFYALPYQGRFIWGATAGILLRLRDKLDKLDNRDKHDGERPC